MSTAADTAPPPDPAELDRLLEDLWSAADMAEGLTSAAELIGDHLLDSSMFNLAKELQDGTSLAWLLEESKRAAARVKSLVGDVEEHLKAGGARPGGPLHSWGKPPAAG